MDTGSAGVESTSRGWRLPPESKELAEARKASKVLVRRIGETEKRLEEAEERRKELIAKLADPSIGVQEQERLRDEARDAAARKLVAGEELGALKNQLVGARNFVKQALENGRAAELLEASEEARRLAVLATIEAFAQVLPSFYRMYSQAQGAEAELRAEVYNCERTRPREDRLSFAKTVLAKAVNIVSGESSPLKSWADLYE